MLTHSVSVLIVDFPFTPVLLRFDVHRNEIAYKLSLLSVSRYNLYSKRILLAPIILAISIHVSARSCNCFTLLLILNGLV
jgi:hypothetical protein